LYVNIISNTEFFKQGEQVVAVAVSIRDCAAGGKIVKKKQCFLFTIQGAILFFLLLPGHMLLGLQWRVFGWYVRKNGNLYVCRIWRGA
jgi:hypothetical protein